MPANDPFRRIRRGERLDGLPTEPWNRLMDGLKGEALPPPETGWEEGPIEIRVQNDAGDPVDRYAVLAIADPFVTYDADPNQFLARDAMIGTTPSSSSRRIVITLQPLADQEVGRARTVGLVRCQVNLTHTDHRYAGPGDTTEYLESAVSGPVQILWIEDDFEEDGQKWAVVFLTGLGGDSQGGGHATVAEAEDVDGLYRSILRIETGRIEDWGSSEEMWLENLTGLPLVAGQTYPITKFSAGTVLGKRLAATRDCCGSASIIDDPPIITACCPGGIEPRLYVDATVTETTLSGGCTGFVSTNEQLATGTTDFVNIGPCSPGQASGYLRRANKNIIFFYTIACCYNDEEDADQWRVTITASGYDGAAGTWFADPTDPNYLNFDVITGWVADGTCDPLCLRFSTRWLIYPAGFGEDPCDGYVTVEFSFRNDPDEDCAGSGSGGGGGGGVDTDCCPDDLVSEDLIVTFGDDNDEADFGVDGETDQFEWEGLFWQGSSDLPVLICDEGEWTVFGPYQLTHLSPIGTYTFEDWTLISESCDPFELVFESTATGVAGSKTIRITFTEAP